MNAIIQTEHLTRRYGRTEAVQLVAMIPAVGCPAS
jgi:hypothetical protein